jgi:glycosyltransferase involved in cell wall biosynthesis
MIAGILAGWAYRRADLIIALGDRMAERLVARGAKVDRVHAVHNWADGDRVRPVAPAENRFLHQYGLDGKFVVGYSGNFGLSHDFSTILESGRRLQGRSDIVFLIIGEGKRYNQVRRDAEGVNAVFLPFQPAEVLSDSLSAASVHVVTLKKGLEGALVPSKIYGVLAVGRPVIFVGPPNSEVAQILRDADCGFTMVPGDVDAFVRAVERLRGNPDERAAMGRRARAAFDAKYERKIGTAKIAALLRNLQLENRYPTTTFRRFARLLAFRVVPVFYA